jgi:hemerythrin
MLIWKSEFETGVAEVDADHRELIIGLNHLETALQSGEGSKTIPKVLAFLEAYANQHFAREEACMYKLQCPTAIANKTAHQQFRQTFARAKERMASSSAAALVAAQVHRELCEWITNHIMKIDSGLKGCTHKAAGAVAKA